MHIRMNILNLVNETESSEFSIIIYFLKRSSFECVYVNDFEYLKHSLTNRPTNWHVDLVVKQDFFREISFN